MRKIIQFDRDWISKVTPGEPFTMSHGDVVPQQHRPVSRRTKEKLTHRTLRQMGELLTVNETATLLKSSDRFIYDLIYAGKLRKTQLGRSIRIATVDLEEYLNASV